MAQWIRLLQELFTQELPLLLALAVLLVGIVAALFVGSLVRRILTAVGIPEAVESTSFERSIEALGTTTVTLLSRLSALFVFVVATVTSFRLVGLLDTQLFLRRLANFLPRLFMAVLAVILGLLIGEKAELVVRDRLQSVKVPEVSIVSKLVKYSIFYIAALIALGQLGIATAALLILLAAYAFGVVFLSAVAFRDLLASGAAGVYLLLTQPYGIGDEVHIDGTKGIVQEVDVFVTHIESEDQERIVPNRQVMREGIVRVRK